MRRRRRLDLDHDHHDRWLISYADFITLLFAFFVVMYAVSAVNESKYRLLANSLGGAFGRPVAQGAPYVRPSPADKPSPQVKPRTVIPPISEERSHMSKVASSLIEVMAPLVKEGKVRVTQSRRGVSIEIDANVLFAPGQAQLEANSLAVLRAVAEKLKQEPFKLEITGHTDVTPISNSAFASNWELSAMRATSVVRLLAANGIAPARLSAIGREASQPVASNMLAQGRARNRRVELMILSGLPETIEEIPVPPPALATRNTEQALR